MEIDQLTDEQIANLTPEQIEMLESDPEKLAEILATQADKDDTKDDPEPAVKKGVANDAGDVKDDDDKDPVVLNKSGKGTIPYEKHKELRVENSSLREQLQAAQASNAEATEKLQALLKNQTDAKGKDVAIADDELAKHLESIKENMPELHYAINAALDGSRKQGEKLEQTLEELKREKEERDRTNKQSIEEQVAEAKENNPDLTHWEANDPEAWDEALKQDEILRTSSKWAKKPYAERFDEVVRRVRAIMPEASALKKPADPEKQKAEAKAKIEAAPARKPTTLSDIQGGANPASEGDEINNLNPHELVAKLMKMPAHKAAALRAGLD